MTTIQAQPGNLEPQQATGDLRVAVIGVGLMGAHHVERLQRHVSGARVTVLADAFTEKAEQLAADIPGCRVLTDPLAAIADPDVDAVVIASPGQFHEEQVLACIDRGIPVLCEKPLTMDAASSLAVVRAEDEYHARTGRRLVQVGFMRRFDPEYVALRQVIADRELGEPLLLHCAHRNPSVPSTFTSEMQLSDSVVHEVDVVRFLTGEEIVAVTVLRPRASRHAVAGQSDPLVVLFETESGVLVDVESFVSTGVAYEVRTELVAEDGSMLIGLDHGPVRQHAGHRTGAITPSFKERFGVAYDVELQTWVDNARRGVVEGPGVWDGYAAALVGEASRSALQQGARVQIEMATR